MDPKTNINYDNKIIYDFSRISINKNEVQSPNTNTSINYFKVPYINKSSNPNFYYTSEGVTKSYDSKNLYIYGLLHNNIIGISDKNPNIIGELVIEMKSTTDTAYLCFLLEKPPPYGAPPSSDVDKILALNKKDSDIVVEVVLNNNITTQENAIVYKNNNSNVFIFTDTIILNEESAKQVYGSSGVGGYDIKSDLFLINSGTDFMVVPYKNVTIKQEEQIYIDCNPAGESNETINTYNLPINSELMNEKQEMDYMKTSVNFAMFSLMVVVCYFLVPSFYKFMVIDKVIRIHENVQKVSGANDVLTRIRTADFLIGIFFILTGYVLFQTGIVSDNYAMYYGSLYVLIFYGLSLSLIGLNKSKRDFMCAWDGDNEKCYEYVPGVPDKNFSLKDIFAFIGIIANFMYEKTGAMILVADLFVFILLLLLWLFGQIPTYWFTFFVCYGCILLTPTLVSLFSLITV